MALLLILVLGLAFVYPRLSWTLRASIVDSLLIGEWPVAFSLSSHFRGERDHYASLRDYLRQNPDVAEVSLPHFYENGDDSPVVLKCRDFNLRDCVSVENRELHAALMATMRHVYHHRDSIDEIVFFSGAVPWEQGNMGLSVIEFPHKVPVEHHCGRFAEIADEGVCYTPLGGTWYLSYDWITDEALQQRYGDSE